VIAKRIMAPKAAPASAASAPMCSMRARVGDLSLAQLEQCEPDFADEAGASY